MPNSQGDKFPFDQRIVWQPNPEWIKKSNLQKFMDRHGISIIDELMVRSTENIEWFWDAVIKDLDIQFYEPYTSIVDLNDGIQFPKWCVGGKMNIVQNCLDKWQKTKIKDRPALRWEGEDGNKKLLTYKELYDEVNKCANALKSLGLSKGDVIGLFMPMIPEIVVAFLAIAKIGGIILPLFSGYGASAVATRLNDASAKALITVDGAYRRGKVVDMKSVADDALREATSVKHVIVVNRADNQINLSSSGRDFWWHELMANQTAYFKTEQTSAEDTVMLIFTSGTTGKPKGAIHSHCGFPIKAAQDLYHCMDLKRENTLYWLTDMGWMMGPWEVFGTLLIGATMVFYDGAPDYPEIDRLWRMVQDHQITHLGVSPTLMRSIKIHGIEPIKKYNLASLRMIGSTGSPWDPESWMWTFENILESKKPILNYSGGTEISGGIVCGNFFKPLKPCAFSAPVPGMAADVLDENGQSVDNAVGELVIRQPWIGMTRGFWNDKERYLETYWSTFENIWLHGDFAAIDEDGLWYILGRSDDTIKIAGKRLGPAEVESLLNAHPAVAESAAIGVPHPIKDQEVVAFCVLKMGSQADEKLKLELINLVISGLGKSLKPKEIKFCDALPKTRNAKVMHRLIKAAYLGNKIGDLSSLENPATIDAIKQAI